MKFQYSLLVIVLEATLVLYAQAVIEKAEQVSGSNETVGETSAQQKRAIKPTKIRRTVSIEEAPPVVPNLATGPGTTITNTGPTNTVDVKPDISIHMPEQTNPSEPVQAAEPMAEHLPQNIKSTNNKLSHVDYKPKRSKKATPAPAAPTEDEPAEGEQVDNSLALVPVESPPINPQMPPENLMTRQLSMMMPQIPTHLPENLFQPALSTLPNQVQQHPPQVFPSPAQQSGYIPLALPTAPDHQVAPLVNVSTDESYNQINGQVDLSKNQFNNLMDNSENNINNVVANSGNTANNVMDGSNNTRNTVISNTGNTEEVHMDGVGNHKVTKITNSGNKEEVEEEDLSLRKKKRNDKDDSDCHHHRRYHPHHHHHEPESYNREPMVQVNINNGQEGAQVRSNGGLRAMNPFIVPVLNNVGLLDVSNQHGLAAKLNLTALLGDRMPAQYMLVQQPDFGSPILSATPLYFNPGQLAMAPMMPPMPIQMPMPMMQAPMIPMWAPMPYMGGDQKVIPHTENNEEPPKVTPAVAPTAPSAAAAPIALPMIDTPTAPPMVVAPLLSAAPSPVPTAEGEEVVWQYVPVKKIKQGGPV